MSSSALASFPRVCWRGHFASSIEVVVVVSGAGGSTEVVEVVKTAGTVEVDVVTGKDVVVLELETGAAPPVLPPPAVF